MNIDKNLYKSIGKQLKIARERKGTFVALCKYLYPDEGEKEYVAIVMEDTTKSQFQNDIECNGYELIYMKRIKKDDTRYVFKLIYSISVK